jgi:hypothetical protein
MMKRFPGNNDTHFLNNTLLRDDYVYDYDYAYGLQHNSTPPPP